ncbi:biotin-dependent carboxyltransferase family protein [Alcaligenaceae bacterium]|nr:biotin-dependent carboxyltransferase family protein [Alcaligenaceae bacterium]
MTITVLRPGLLSNFQDLGRFGHQHLGVPVSGAMDSRAHRLANLLAGNPEDEATLEITLVGPTLQFHTAGCIAISGAQLNPTLNDKAIPNNRPITVQAGDTLAFGTRTSGLRAYLAWHGGYNLPEVLNSRSTYLRGHLGGYQGRALLKGDTLTPKACLDPTNLDQLQEQLWKLRVYLPAILGFTPKHTIRAIKGPHTALFTEASIRDFFSSPYRISTDSERMGYRLGGPHLSLQQPKTQLLSEAISFGSVQVPPDGNPIVLMADRQTTGGYAKIAHIITVDLPLVAQAMPGEHLQFTEVTLAQAQQLDLEREAAFDRLYQTLKPLRELLEASAIPA